MPDHFEAAVSFGADPGPSNDTGKVRWPSEVLVVRSPLTSSQWVQESRLRLADGAGPAAPRRWARPAAVTVEMPAEGADVDWRGSAQGRASSAALERERARFPGGTGESDGAERDDLSARRSLHRCERFAPSRALLGRRSALGDRRRGPDEIGLVPTDDTSFRIVFQPVPEQKAGKNRIHLDLTSTSIDDQKETVERLVELGARHIDVASARTTTMSCSPTPKATSSASSSRATPSSLAADASDRSRATARGEVGCFWSEALGWPLVWDQDEETAIRSPHGRPFITWASAAGLRRRDEQASLDIAPPDHGDQRAEVDRLVTLGASRTDIGQGEVGSVAMAESRR